MWRRRDQHVCTPRIADPYHRWDDYDQDKRKSPRSGVTAPIRKTGTANAAVRAPCITTAITTRMIIETTIIATTTTKVRTIDLGAKVIIIGCVQGQALNTSDAREDFMNVGATIPVNPLSQAHETEMSREIAIIKLLPESLNTGLEQRDHIHVFRMLDNP